MRGFSKVLFQLFLSPAGLVVLAALESTIFFWFPFGIDAAVIVLAVRHPNSRWLYPLLATVGSVAGTVVTYEMGKKLGEAGLDRYVSQRRLASVKASVEKRGAIALALLGIIPPPFPFTAFVLASGALDVDAVRVLGAVGAVRLVRFALETALAARYGTTVLRWMNSDLVVEIVGAVIVLAIVASVISLWALFRKRRPALAHE